jgi:hypothetical protein
MPVAEKMEINFLFLIKAESSVVILTFSSNVERKLIPNQTKGPNCKKYRKRESKKLPVKIRYRWKDNMKVYDKVIESAGCRLDSSGSGYEPVTGSCKHGYEGESPSRP